MVAALTQNSKQLNELLKILKSPGLSSREENASKILLNKDDKIKFQLRENANISKKFYFELPNDLVKIYQWYLTNIVASPLKITFLIYLT